MLCQIPSSVGRCRSWVGHRPDVIPSKLPFSMVHRRARSSPRCEGGQQSGISDRVASVLAACTPAHTGNTGTRYPPDCRTDSAEASSALAAES